MFHKQPSQRPKEEYCTPVDVQSADYDGRTNEEVLRSSFPFLKTDHAFLSWVEAQPDTRLLYTRVTDQFFLDQSVQMGFSSMKTGEGMELTVRVNAYQGPAAIVLCPQWMREMHRKNIRGYRKGDFWGSRLSEVTEDRPISFERVKFLLGFKKTFKDDRIIVLSLEEE